MQLPVPPTRFFGRVHERAAACALLMDPAVRLITLSGSGGIGKTRLALEVAHSLRDEFPDGIGFVDLSALGDAAHVLPAVASAVGIHEGGAQPLQQRLQEHLRRQRFLFLVDNFEHVMPAAADLAVLLGATEWPKLLLTSRLPLRVRWEHIIQLSGLSLPSAQPGSDDATNMSEALALFVDRSGAASGAAEPTPDDIGAMAEICRRLDGVPLAIELAAARSRVLSSRALLARLDNPLTLLTSGLRDAPERHHTLRRALDWSYQLLTPRERRFFAWLGVFVGSFTLDAATVVAADAEPLPLQLMESLVDHSLLLRDGATGAEPTFRMLATVREFALERLADDPQSDLVSTRHARYYLEMAEHAAPQLGGGASLPVLHRLAAEYSNLRAALDWLLQHDRVLALRLAGALRRFWMLRGELSEGRRWLRRALDGATDASPAVHATALLAAADLAAGQADFHEGIALYQQSLALWEAAGEHSNAALVLNNLGNCYRLRGDLDNASAHFERSRQLWRTSGNAEKEAKVLGNLGLVALGACKFDEADTHFSASLAMFLQLGDALNIARALNNRGYALMLQARYGEAKPILQESLARFRRLGEKLGLADSLSNLSMVYLGLDDVEQANSCALESLQLFEALGDQNGMAECFEHLAAVAAAKQQPQRGTQLLAAAAQLRVTIDSRLPPGDLKRLEILKNQLRRRLGHKRFATAWLLGQACSVDAVLELARSPSARPGDTATAARQSSVSPPDTAAAMHQADLSSRELEVLALLAGGLTYDQIADRLVISPRTVNRHLTSIYGKINVSTRHAAARWALDHSIV